MKTRRADVNLTQERAECALKIRKGHGAKKDTEGTGKGLSPHQTGLTLIISKKAK